MLGQRSLKFVAAIEFEIGDGEIWRLRQRDQTLLCRIRNSPTLPALAASAELVMIVEIIIVVEGFAVFCWIKNRKSMHSFLLNFELSSRYAVALRRTIALAA